MPKRFLNPLIALLFVVISSVFIALFPSFHYFIPAQQVELSHGVQYGAALKDFLFVQEITMKQRYLSRVDVYMAKLPSQYQNNNVFLLIDDQKRILFTQRFSSADFGEALHFPFRFGKSFDIGKGRMVYACIYSLDGDQQSYIGLARKENGRIGKLYVMPVLNGDVLKSFQDRQSVTDFTGTLGVKTFESDSVFFSVFQIILMIIALIPGMLILFREKVWAWILRIRIRPEMAFGITALIFGMVMVVITPPFQVPDEPAHFYRSYQVAKFNLFKVNDDIPYALVNMADTCGRMQFSTHEKTSAKEIIAWSKTKRTREIRNWSDTPNYLIPYFPQAIGLIIGRILGLDLQWWLYLGRFFNLLAAVFLVFMAIRITPVFKWVLTMVGLLPMTIYQFASLSYDVSTIGLSFLLLAMILRLAFDNSQGDLKRQTIWLFVVAILLAASKPPYFLIVFTFLIIPVSRFGNMKKYLKVFVSLAIISLIITLSWKPMKTLAARFAEMPQQTAIQQAGIIDVNPLIDPVGNLRSFLSALKMFTPDIQAVGSIQEQPAPTTAASPPAEADSAGKQPPPAMQQVTTPFDPQGQIRYVLSHPFTYVGVLFDSALKYGNLYMVSAVGLFGWIDTQLPEPLAYLYLLILVLLALFSPAGNVKIGPIRKLIFLAVFISIFALILTALYMYCNPIGNPYIIAVQGRYFIAVLPILLLLLYNNQLTTWVNGLSGKKPSKEQGRKNAGKKNVPARTQEPAGRSSHPISLIPEILPLFAFLYGIVTLIWSVFLILDRFYVLTL